MFTCCKKKRKKGMEIHHLALQTIMLSSHSHRRFISARLLGRLFLSVLSSGSVALINLRDSGLYIDVGCCVATGTKDTLKSDISDQSDRNEIHLQKSESKRFRPPKIVVLDQFAKITFHYFCFLLFVYSFILFIYSIHFILFHPDQMPNTNLDMPKNRFWLAVWARL